MPMISFRRIVVEGPDIGSASRVWQAQLNLGHPFQAGGEGPLIRNHSIRLLAQTAQPSDATIVGETAPGNRTTARFHEPLLLTAAATAHKLGDSDSEPVVGILSAEFNPVALDGESRYCELHVAPGAAWPDNAFRRTGKDNVFQLDAPNLRATAGAIPVACADPALHGTGELSTRLSMDWTPLEGRRVTVFGCLQIDTTETRDGFGSPPKKARAVIFELVPEGVEFDAWVPDPFATEKSLLDVRLRLVAVQRVNQTEMRLDLVGGSEKSLGILAGGLAWMSRDLVARGGSIVLQIDSRGVPPLSWPLAFDKGLRSYSCGTADVIPEVLLREEGIGVKVLTRTDPTGGEPGVAEMVRHIARLSARAPGAPAELTIMSMPNDTAAPATGPAVALSWSEPPPAARIPGGNPDAVTLQPFAGTAAVEALVERLSAVWGSSGAIAEKARPPYAFIALDRGWVQIPLPDAPMPDAPKPSRASTNLSAFAGFLRIDVPLKTGTQPDGTDLPGLLIAAASGVSIVVRWTKPQDSATPRTIAVNITDAFGVLDGLLWAGEASPSPIEILPPRDAGPAALDSIPIIFGGRDTPGWSVDVDRVDAGMLGNVTFSLPVVARPDGGPPLLVWGAHDALALVSSVAMTRTAESALHPSATRELVPTQVARTGQLGMSFDNGKRLPRATLPAGTSVNGDGSWRWPWPPQLAAGADPYPSSPREQAGVALASLTLPGVEFTLRANASMLDTSSMLVSLRFDLPLLDELFANARAPEPKVVPARKQDAAPAQDRPPTALDLRRLSDFWFENARRIARARTEADRVVLDESKDGKISLWHDPGTELTTASVHGLVEPYVWKPDTFAFRVTRPDQGVNLGAYCLGTTTRDSEWYAGGRALGGLTANFVIDGDSLRPGTGGEPDIKVDGFAPSSFKAQPRPLAESETAPDQLHDARGLSLALDPNTSSDAFTSRDISIRKAPGDQRLSLATLRTPIEVAVGPNRLGFWFRDLPITGGDRLVFDRSGGIETGLGSDPEAISRNRIAKSLYEWRFYPKVDAGAVDADALGKFEFPLAGPLVARPLRLVAFEMNADGTPVLLQVVASVKLAEPTPEQPGEMVFAAEDAYASGNLVLLSFDDSAGTFGFRSIVQVTIGDNADEPFLQSPAELVFRADAQIVPASTAPITLGLVLAAKNGAVYISSASLTARLFGQACKFDLRDAAFAADAIAASCRGDPGDSPLQMKEFSLRWPKVGAPELTLDDARLRAPLRANDASSPFAFVRNYGSRSIDWLGLSSTEGLATEEIDHDAGVIVMRMDFDHTTASATLFRGFLLPPGRLRGAIAFVLKRTPSGAVTGWPVAKLGSAFIEFAFDAAGPATAQRIQAIRHRHVGRSGSDPVWCSSLRLDADFSALKTSTIAWPVGDAIVGNAIFDPDPGKKPDWTTTLTMTRTKMFDLVHEVQPRLCAHELPLALLALDEAGVIALREPWLFRAVVKHALTPAESQTWPGSDSRAPLAWTSVDQLCLMDMQALVREAGDEFRAPDESAAYAFMSRYRDGGNGPDIRIAGVVRRALAQAGFPTRPILQKIFNDYDRSPDKVPESLVLTGSCLTEAVTDRQQAGLRIAEIGVSFVPQWILPWAQSNADDLPDIGSLAACPQVDDTTSRYYTIAAYDAAAATPRRLDGPAPGSFSAQDGTQSLVDARFAATIGVQPGEEAAATMAVDQAFLGSASEPPNPLARPLFPRTLLALATVAKSFAKAPDPRRFGQGLRCVAPSHDLPRREIRFTVSAWPPDGAPVESLPPAVTLLVADEDTITAEILPSALASGLSDPASEALAVQGPQRAEAAVRAFSLSAAPRAVMLARVDQSYLAIHEAKSAPGDEVERMSITDALTLLPHVDWEFARTAAPGLVGQPSIVLRERAVTIHASPALGWPNEKRTEELARAHARLGDEEVRRNDRAWAGRVRSIAWSAQAWGPADGTPVEQQLREEMDEAAFIAMGQRTAFRRRAASNFRSPPDRLAVLAPPRARAPTPESLAEAFDQSRIPHGEGDLEFSHLAPLLPGQIEVTTTGQRPGATMTQHEGILLTWRQNAFDPEFARFGRPAARGPLIVRQLRAPRSSALPDDPDLALRRRTFIAGDQKDGKNLRPFKLVSGPAIVLRFDRTSDPDDGQYNPRSVTFSIVSPGFGWLSSAWDGRIRLAATVPGDIPARIALARVGLLPPQRDPVTEHMAVATLQVAGTVVRFNRMIWGETIGDQGGSPGKGDARRLLVEFIISEPTSREAARRAIATALGEASADTQIRFAVRCGVPLEPKDADSRFDPAPSGGQELAPDEIGRPEAPVDEEREDLISGPPKTIVFDLPHIPAQRRWLPLMPFTLCFGDPAYDRELGSPTRTGQLAIADVPHVLAIDRAEYDTGATIHFAFWKQEKTPDPNPAPPEGAWALSIKVVPRDGGPERTLGIAATNTSGIRYFVRGKRPYAIPIPGLREVRDQALLADTPANISPGDRLRIVVSKIPDSPTQPSLSVDLGIVPEPVLPPPAASYGLATLHDGGVALGAALFATAPLPQVIDFPQLLEDLIAGHVRRRGLFLWRFVSSYLPAAATPFASLVKADRTGGGQQPDSRSDFVSYESE
ncbi:hypothetical protein DBIPINDM_001869 [Mesorhizobium sp. AR02]|uniref:hypothetical protein n=1 Tax=Mesorhizobium sp. AR02 TaxID=2865837 RepID=UPI00215E8B67|nr:hypothetical protein [Mesorhizobium sp. AR02]UVK55361.1 hypothetical protein DBIPINDM_001869 [Mesorhizobium sp. AR02]